MSVAGKRANDFFRSLKVVRQIFSRYKLIFAYISGSLPQEEFMYLSVLFMNREMDRQLAVVSCGRTIMLWGKMELKQKAKLLICPAFHLCSNPHLRS